MSLSYIWKQKYTYSINIIQHFTADKNVWTWDSQDLKGLRVTQNKELLLVIQLKAKIIGKYFKKDNKFSTKQNKKKN